MEGTKSFFAPERFLRASDNLDADERKGYASYEQKSYGSSHSTDQNNESEEKDEGYEDTDNLDEVTNSLIYQVLFEACSFRITAVEFSHDLRLVVMRLRFLFPNILCQLI